MGLSRRAIRTICDELLVVCAAYAASVLYDAVMIVVGKRKILTCQRIAFISACRAVSTDALQILAGVSHLDLELIRRNIATLQYRL